MAEEKKSGTDGREKKSGTDGREKKSGKVFFNAQELPESFCGPGFFLGFFPNSNLTPQPIVAFFLTYFMICFLTYFLTYLKKQRITESTVTKIIPNVFFPNVFFSSLSFRRANFECSS